MWIQSEQGYDYILRNNYIHDVAGTPIQAAATGGVLIEHNHIVRNNVHIVGGHSAAIVGYYGSYDFTVRYNTFEDISGTGIITMYGHHWDIYGNLFLQNQKIDNTGLGNGIIATANAPAPITDINIFGNVFANGNGPCGIYAFYQAARVSVFNNVFANCSHLSFPAGDSNRHYYNLIVRSSIDNPLSPHELQSDVDPFVDGPRFDFHLSTTSMARDAGLNLATLDVYKDEMATDLDGEPRGADAHWDIGAYR